MVIVSVDVADPFGTVAGLNVQPAPLGRPEHERVTALSNPFSGVTVTVEVAD